MAALPRLRKRLCSGREEASRLKEAQVRHRFVVPTLVSECERAALCGRAALRADVEERLFRAVSASAFHSGLQPRPALKGIHPPAVAEPAPEKMASPPKDVSTGSPRSQGNNDAEWRSRSERLSCVG